MDIFNSTSEYLELIERYRIIAENTVECIWLFDLANRCFKYISLSIFNLRGLTVEDAMNEKIEECFTPEALKKIQAQGMTRLPQFLSRDRNENITSNSVIFDVIFSRLSPGKDCSKWLKLEILLYFNVWSDV